MPFKEGNQLWRLRAKPITMYREQVDPFKDCIICGEEFKTERNRITCSERCSMIRQRERKAEDKRRYYREKIIRSYGEEERRTDNVLHLQSRDQRSKDKNGSLTESILYRGL